MPKERRDRSISSDRSRASPFPCSSSRSRRSPKRSADTEEDIKEWEEARCPVCMEHPHNAILLLCSSHEKGCRPYMCDTSYRHSNCFDQFRKSFLDNSSPVAPQDETDAFSNNSSSSTVTIEPVDRDLRGRSEEPVGRQNTPCENQVPPKLVCPLCRGQITGWVVVESARLFMNAKSRSCSCETCEFSGTYTDLRKHARLEHPLVRPSEADPERQRNWRRLERQRDLADVLSTIQSSFGDVRDEDGLLPMDDGGLLTVFFLIRVFRPAGSSRSSSWSGMSRARAQIGVRRRLRRLWGESYEGESGSAPREEENESSDGGSEPRRRRRLRRRVAPDEQQ
ncbi:Protein of unknown function DUF1644 [Dillenia turbinata]|uniref:Uncharacterized protein n=1 Tax=Dillenia turbinata TaxID=194707 RepID=A0AAN8W806_9MAGN